MTKVQEAIETIDINGLKYVRADSIQGQAVVGSRGPFTLVRTYSAGVFVGELVSRNGKECVLANARRLWYWKGAASLSQIAMEGVSAPNECKFPAAVAEITLTEAIELIPVTTKAKTSIDSVPVWRV